jgi:hypothetical protein
MRVVAGRRERLPFQSGQEHRIARRQRGVEREARTALSRGAIAELAFVPVAHRGRLGGRDRGAAAVARLQRGVAAAVIGMQVGIDQAVERPPLQRVLDERHRLRRVRVIAAVDQRGAGLVLQDNIVGRQPAALEDRDAGRQADHVSRRTPRPRGGGFQARSSA